MAIDRIEILIDKITKPPWNLILVMLEFVAELTGLLLEWLKSHEALKGLVEV